MKKKGLRNAWARFLDKADPKDIFGGVGFLFGMYLISQGINSTVSGIVIALTAYYFRKRME